MSKALGIKRLKTVTRDPFALLHHSEQAVVYAAHCGQKLIEAKAACQHGEWLQWLKGNCAVRARQATKYMQLAKEMPELIDSNRHCNADLPSVNAAIALLSAPEDVKQEIKEAVAEGKTFTEAEIKAAIEEAKAEADERVENWRKQAAKVSNAPTTISKNLIVKGWRFLCSRRGIGFFSLHGAHCVLLYKATQGENTPSTDGEKKMKTAAEVLAQAGYSEDEIKIGMDYADQFDWVDEDERGAYALARILYKDDSQLEDNEKAPWEPCCD
jgi:hypothetical protein